MGRFESIRIRENIEAEHHRRALKAIDCTERMQVEVLASVIVFVDPEVPYRDFDGLLIGFLDPFAAKPTLHAYVQDTIPNSRPTSTNASTARSMSSIECAADICVRMRAWPFGTTGNEKPIT